MDTLICQLKTELKITESEAIDIVKAIAEYVENQHPLLKDLVHDLMNKELENHNS